MGYNVIHTRIGKDDYIVDRATALGLKVYSPKTVEYTTHKRTKKRLAQISPLFPEYVFIQEHAALTISMFHGNAMYILKNEGKEGPYAVVPDKVISQIRDAENRGDFDGTRIDRIRAAMPIGSEVSIEVFNVMLKGIIESITGEVAKIAGRLHGKRIVKTVPLIGLRAINN